MDKSELKKLFKQRDTLIASINARFEAQVKESQRSLLRMFMEKFADKLQLDENKNVINNQYNRTLLLSVDKLFLEFGKSQNPLLMAQLIGGVMNVLDFNAKYYSNLTPNAKLLPLRAKVLENVKGWLGIEGNATKPNGYLDTLVKADQVKNQLKQSVMKMVYGQEGWESTRKQLAKLIEGDRDGLGALQKYHRNFTYDLYSQIDRATAKTYADDLKFNFAIYEGGLIETSREFCKEHNGNVYHRSEIEEFNPKVAKQPDYNPFTDLGGYACRHHLNWIPDSLAKALRPEIVDLFENKNDSLRSKDEAEKILDDLPKGTIFDDAKRIETIFKKSNHSWSEARETLDKNKDAGKITEIDLDKIEITQPNIQSNKVKKMLSNTKELPLIDVVQFADGTYAIPDGHHRLTTGYLLGEKKIKVNLIKQR